MVEISNAPSSKVNDALEALSNGQESEQEGKLDDVLPAPVRLQLGELLQDVAGEVVLYNDSNQPVVEIETERQVTDRGDVAHHTTASGETVDGYRFVAFDNGVKLYHSDDVDLVIRPSDED